jgi:hypothetical protein
MLSLFRWWFGLFGPLYAVQLSVSVRNARLDAIETTIGASPIIEFRTGAMPADCATAASGTLLAQSALPADWMAAAVAGVKGKLGTWSFSGLAGIVTANVGYFRIYDAGSPSQCHLQGTVTATGGGGDMTVDNISIAAAQVVTVNSFNLTDANA